MEIYNKEGSSVCDTVFHYVVVISHNSRIDNEITKTYEYYAPNLGLVESITISENDTIHYLKLLEYDLN